MNLRQLRALCEIVDNDLKITRAAHALHTSQPSVSRYVASLEQELGVPLFLRVDKRIVGLTKAGTELVEVARRLLREADTLREMSKDLASDAHGELTIGASHTTACYFLPTIVVAFRDKHPNVRLVIRQGDPTRVAELVATGDADLSVSPADPKTLPRELVALPCHKHERIVLAPAGHPLAAIRRPTLAQLAKFPLITYSSEFAAQTQVVRAFESAGHTPNIVLTASDVDVMKTYVRCGLGVAIVAAPAYDAQRDVDLKAISIRHLLPSITVSVWLRRGNYMRGYIYDFIALVSPALTRQKVEHALHG